MINKYTPWTLFIFLIYLGLIVFKKTKHFHTMFLNSWTLKIFEKKSFLAHDVASGEVKKI